MYMNKTKIRKLQVPRNPEDYVNKETGELLSSELREGVSITVNEKTNQFIINSNEYVVFDSEAIIFLSQCLSRPDMARVLSLSNMVKGDCSVIYQNNNHPHTPETLSSSLDVCLNEWYLLVRRLVKKNVLAYAVCAPSGFVQKIYMLNPYIARKRKVINCELQSFFRDVTKDLVTHKEE